ncbi:MAG: trypsin-like peptidase domain-containing protein [Acutalibacteraceae bacterium]
MNNENFFGDNPKDNSNNNQPNVEASPNISAQNNNCVEEYGVPQQQVANTPNMMYGNNTPNINNSSYGSQYGSNANGNMPYGNQYGANANGNMPYGNQYGANANGNVPYQNQYNGNVNTQQINQNNAGQIGNPVSNNPYGSMQGVNQNGDNSYSNVQNNLQGNAQGTAPYPQQTSSPIQYLPITPNTVLPEGVQPVYMNGGWYYPVFNLQKPQKPKKPKTPLSIKVLLGIIVAMIVGFSVTLFFWVDNLDDNGNSLSWDSFLYQAPTESATTKKYDDEISYKYADPNGPEIKLKDNKTKDGSAEKAYEKLSDSVVSIAVYDKGETPDTNEPTSEGTGIIISDEGHIVTNSHVVFDDLDSNVWIITKDDEKYSAVVVGVDETTDLAVLLCQEDVEWDVAEFADSKQLKVGQEVVAIGSPGGIGYSSSITRGVVSALERQVSGNSVAYIQTDTAMNPGNSGGPLANLNGQVVGINTIKIVDTEYEGMGFAIPSVTIKKVVNQLIKNGYVSNRVKMGIMATEISSAFAKAYDMDMGIAIESISVESPLNDTKVKENDIITKIDGKKVSNFVELYEVLDEYEPGDEVTLTICRYDEKNPSDNETFKVEIELIGDKE